MYFVLPTLEINKNCEWLGVTSLYIGGMVKSIRKGSALIASCLKHFFLLNQAIAN
jgi:hypothetical protein